MVAPMIFSELRFWKIDFIFIDYCLNEKAGVRFGKNSIRYVQLQVHWTNEAKADDYYDSSGIKLFYTPKLRKYDQGIMPVGQMHLELPPGQKKVSCMIIFETYCSDNGQTGGPVSSRICKRLTDNLHIRK